MNRMMPIVIVTNPKLKNDGTVQTGCHLGEKSGGEEGVRGEDKEQEGEGTGKKGTREKGIYIYHFCGIYM